MSGRVWTEITVVVDGTAREGWYRVDRGRVVVRVVGGAEVERVQGVMLAAVLAEALLRELVATGGA